MKCCMEDCSNEVNPETDFLWIEPDGYACESCMEAIGDE